MINCLLSSCPTVHREAKEAAKERVYAYHTESNESLHKAGQVLKLFTDDRIAAESPLPGRAGQGLYDSRPASRSTSLPPISPRQARFDETGFQWEHLDGLAPQFKRHLRPLLLAVDLARSRATHPLLEAVHFLQAAFRKGQSLANIPP